MNKRIGQIGALAAIASWMTAPPAAAQLAYQTLDFGTTGTFLTGIRGDNIVGNYVIPGTGETGGLLYRSSTGRFTPFPVATPSGTNFPGSIGSSPYGPSFGSETGILRAVGSYKTSASSPYDLSYLYDGAAAPQARLVTLFYPGAAGAPTLNTIAHSTFGNQVVGNYDTQLKTGNAFIYDIKTGAYTTNNTPGAVSTTAYGVWATKTAGGYAQLGPGGGPGFERGYIYDQSTGVWTTYNHPGAVVTHFEGITGAGRAGEYNLIADWVDLTGHPRASVLHLDAAGHETWIEIAVPGASLTSANSVYEDKVIGVYSGGNGVTNGYLVSVPGIYNPIRNLGSLTTAMDDTPAIASGAGDDVVNTGSIQTSGARSPGIRSSAYGVITNNGLIAVTGPGSAAVELNGPFGTLLNAGSITASSGADAIRTGASAAGMVIVNGGTIDGRIAISPGVDARFENSGRIGISAPGAGTTHTIGGTFAQTSAGSLALRLAADGSRDALRVSGTAQLAGELTLVPQPGLYASQTIYSDLVSATDALRDGFETVSTLSPFLDGSIARAGNSFAAVLTRRPFNALPGLTQNQRAVGSGLENGYRRALDTGLDTGLGASLYSTLLTSWIAPDAVARSYDAIGGEGLTGTQQTTFTAASRFVEAMREQGAFWLTAAAQNAGGQAAADAPEGTSNRRGTWRVWAGASGSGGHLDSDPSRGAASLSAHAWGGAAGIDVALSPNLLVGIAGGGSGSNFSVSQRSTSGTVDGGQLGIYAIGQWDGPYVSGAFAWGHYSVDTTRSLSAFALTETNSGSFDATVLTGRVEAGYIAQTELINITPFAALESSWINQPSFVETPGISSSPIFALAVSDKTATSVPTSLGIQFDRGAALDGGWTLAPSLRAAWLHEWDTARSFTANLVAAPGAGFTLAGTPASRNAARFTGSLKLAQAANLALYANVLADVSPHGQSIAGNIGVKLTW
jgi:subtilase-type serine protease